MLGLSDCADLRVLVCLPNFGWEGFVLVTDLDLDAAGFDLFLAIS